MEHDRQIKNHQPCSPITRYTVCEIVVTCNTYVSNPSLLTIQVILLVKLTLLDQGPCVLFWLVRMFLDFIGKEKK